jgi:quercetin dioxygenase-like cupin family protein
MRTVKPEFLLSAMALTLICAIQPAAATAATEVDLPHAFDAGWKGQKTCELLFEDATVRVARCVFPPGIGHEKHYHNPHFGYVLESGTMKIVNSKGEREVRTEAGTHWSTTQRTVHEAVNTGDTATGYLVVEPK